MNDERCNDVMWAHVWLCCRLTLNRSGGQCLDEAGARVRRWGWSSQSPTPLQPVFLSLNKTVGVRILGREQVFVSFLAKGQQARISVGTCCAQVKHCFSIFNQLFQCFGGTSTCISSSAVLCVCKAFSSFTDNMITTRMTLSWFHTWLHNVLQ